MRQGPPSLPGLPACAVVCWPAVTVWVEMALTGLAQFVMRVCQMLQCPPSAPAASPRRVAGLRLRTVALGLKHTACSAASP